MQKDPEKLFGNYNEFLGITTPVIRGSALLQVETQEACEPREIVATGIRLVNDKVNEILGPNNMLTRPDLVPPETKFIDADPKHPTWLGYFSPQMNEIVVITSRVKDRLSQTKVFIHEYIHFLSHNGRDEYEKAADNSPIALNNNIGFRRSFGLDIRKGKEGKNTSDYFLSFNEAAAEQLAIDIFPGVVETYDDYRGLFNKVIDDAVVMGLGSNDAAGDFQPWSRQQIKNYIYLCFFRGNLNGFTQLLQNIYKKYDISEQQFGLMTHKSDLPTVIEKTWIQNHPDDPPPSPGHVRRMLQTRLDNKTPDDYVTDTIVPEPGGGSDSNQVRYGTEYDTFVEEEKIAYSHKEIIGGHEYDIDSQEYIIYHGEDATQRLGNIKAVLDDLLVRASRGEIDAADIADQIDQLLFETHFISMLSDGFRDFYIYKHSRIESL